MILGPTTTRRAKMLRQKPAGKPELRHLAAVPPVEK
jgi:hypothetical protein